MTAKKQGTCEDWSGLILGLIWAAGAIAGAILLGIQMYTWLKTGGWPARPLAYYLPRPADMTSWLGLQTLIGLILKLPTALTLFIAPLPIAVSAMYLCETMFGGRTEQRGHDLQPHRQIAEAAERANRPLSVWIKAYLVMAAASLIFALVVRYS